jgi:hypothetical protein
MIASLADRGTYSVVVQLVAGLAFLAFLWMLLRFALGLRHAKVLREEARGAQSGIVVAEIPSAAGDVGFFIETFDAFEWPTGFAKKTDILGARLLLRGGVIGTVVRPGIELPPAGPVDEFEGRERWDVVLFLDEGATATVACGTLREGVSRDVAARVFEAVRAAI